MSPLDTAFLLAACDAFRRCAEVAGAADQRQHWYTLADRARRAYEADAGRDGTEIAAVNEAGRVINQGHHRAKLTDKDVELIHALRDGGLSLAQIALKFEVARSTVADICNGRTRSHTVMGHRPARSNADPVIWPATVDEFEAVYG